MEGRGGPGVARGRNHGLAAAGPAGVAGMRRGLTRNPGASPGGSRAGQWQREAISQLPAARSGRALPRGEGRRCRSLLGAPAPGTGSAGKEGWWVGDILGAG